LKKRRRRGKRKRKLFKGVANKKNCSPRKEKKRKET